MIKVMFKQCALLTIQYIDMGGRGGGGAIGIRMDDT